MLERIGGFALGLLLFAALTVLEVPAAPAAQAASGVVYVQGAAFGTGTQVSSLRVPLTKPIGAGELLVGWFSQYDAAGKVGCPTV